MANTYSQIQLHIVFAVKYRAALLDDSWRDELFAYMGGIIKNMGHHPTIVGGYRDHVHLCVGFKPSFIIPNVVKDLKLASNAWIQPRCRCHFGWQDGYSVFSVSKTHEAALIEYIKNQPEHHKKVSMVEELKTLLDKNHVEYDEKYLPHEPI